MTDFKIYLGISKKKVHSLREYGIIEKNNEQENRYGTKQRDPLQNLSGRE